MLSRLSIKNYAIIDHLEIDFSEHLNAITGETGAGKSIIVGALGLILGQRADIGVLLNREKKCIVEGTFKSETGDKAVNSFLKENELDVQDDLAVRREISPNGKSRAFVNDTPVNLSQLAQLSSLLVDLHQQFDTLELSQTDFQREVLDALGGNSPALKTYRQTFEKAQEVQKRFELLKEQKAGFLKEFDVNRQLSTLKIFSGLAKRSCVNLFLIMLSRLSIKNYAIIDHLEIDFSEHLNAITGETGAGKSIIVGALGLILGQRADIGVLLNREKKCIVEGTFKSETGDKAVNSFLKENELDVQDDLAVRREISPNGKSRAFVNDTPVNLSQLAQLSSLLVDLHQQFDTLELSQTDFQREVLDALGGNSPALKTYRQTFEKAQEVQKRFALLKEQKAGFLKEFDYHQFQYNELEEASFKENELEETEQQLKMQTNAEEIKMALTKTYFELEESDNPVTRQLKSLINNLQSYTEFHTTIPELIQRLQSANIELQDIAAEADRLNNQVASDANIIERLNERLSLGYKLLKKHGVKTTGDLLQIKENLSEKLEAVLNIDEAIETAQKQYEEMVGKAEEMAISL